MKKCIFLVDIYVEKFRNLIENFDKYEGARVKQLLKSTKFYLFSFH